jgi:hypothetical protein
MNGIFIFIESLTIFVDMLCLNEESIFKDLIFEKSIIAESEFNLLIFLEESDRLHIMSFLESLVCKNKYLLSEVFDAFTHEELMRDLQNHKLDI